MSYDLPGSFGDRVDGLLLEGVSRGPAGSMKRAYLHLVPRTEDGSHVFVPLVFVLVRHAKRPGILDTSEVLVQGVHEKVNVLFFEALVPFAHDAQLCVLRAGHRDEAIEGTVGGSWMQIRRVSKPQGFISHFLTHVSSQSRVRACCVCLMPQVTFYETRLIC